MGDTPRVGLIANPVSARDIRRVIANASSLQIADRASIILRAMAALASCGVRTVVAMPDAKGIRAMLDRGASREHNLGRAIPDVEYVDMPVTSTVVDTHRAAAAMAEQGVAAIIVLGGDGTHRAVVQRCGDIPIAGISTGTNNAFPETRESTIVGLATGLYSSGALDAADALAGNKLLAVDVNDGQRTDIALIDVVISTERFIGARALWHPASLRELFVSYADPTAVGLSAIAGLLAPVDRRTPVGRRLVFAHGSDEDAVRVRAPIAPGMIDTVCVSAWEVIHPDVPVKVTEDAGTVALDGERELELEPGDRVTVTLLADAFRSIDVARCMQLAATRGLFRDGEIAGRATPVHRQQGGST